MILEEIGTFQVGNSVRITHLNPNVAKSLAKHFGSGVTPEDIAKRLGTRQLGLQGVVTKSFLFCGGFVNEVAYVDEQGSRNGTMGIIFPGEGERIPDILVRS